MIVPSFIECIQYVAYRMTLIVFTVNHIVC